MLQEKAMIDLNRFLERIIKVKKKEYLAVLVYNSKIESKTVNNLLLSKIKNLSNIKVTRSSPKVRMTHTLRR